MVSGRQGAHIPRVRGSSQEAGLNHVIRGCPAPPPARRCRHRTDHHRRGPVDLLAGTDLVRSRCGGARRFGDRLHGQGRPPRGALETLVRGASLPSRKISMNPPASVSAVVVPVDGSSLSCRAIPVGVSLARRLGASLHLFSAVPTADEVGERDAALAGLLAGIEDLPSARTVVVDLDVPGAIHEELRRLAPAMACMATRGRGRSAALFGSVVAETLARGHDALVLVGPFVGDGPKPEHEPRGLMVCVDSSPWSSCLVGISVAYAQRLGEALLIATRRGTRAGARASPPWSPALRSRWRRRGVPGGAGGASGR